jgi:hypothetical protein
MGDLFGGGGDGGAAEAAMAEQRKETERLRAQTEADKRDMLEKQQAGLKARQRGGARALLSTERLDGEEGLKDTLGG